MNSPTGLKFLGRRQAMRPQTKRFQLRGFTSTVILAISMSVLSSGVSLISMSSSAKAATFGDFQYTTDNGGVVILNYYGSSQNITIPSVIDGLPVTTIGNKAFWKNGQLNSVIFGTPSSVTSIGNFAFNLDTALTSITIPNSVTRIGYAAIAQDSSLTSINIGNSVKKIDNAAFN